METKEKRVITKRNIKERASDENLKSLSHTRRYRGRYLLLMNYAADALIGKKVKE